MIPVDLHKVAMPNKKLAGMICIDLTVKAILLGSTFLYIISNPRNVRRLNVYSEYNEIEYIIE